MSTTDPNAVPFRLDRLAIVMEPERGNPHEVEGVLNPAAARGPDGALYLFPRLVAAGNYSRIGRARVLFDGDGNPAGVERLGVALEPGAAYEALGCEDPRITYLEPLTRWVMTYTAVSPAGARIALAASRDLVTWDRLGPVRFDCYRQRVNFGDVPNKDALFFPIAVPGPDGAPSLALLHRPLFPETAPDRMLEAPATREIDPHRESIWLSYTDLARCEADLANLALFRAHHTLAMPAAPWEHIKIGGGAPPVAIPAGWLVLYHGVAGDPGGDGRPRRLTYSAGALVLDRHDPRTILYRSSRPVLAPELAEEMEGTVANVVFPTATDHRHDVGEPDRIDVYYGMADSRIGAARLYVPPSPPPDVTPNPHEDAP